MLGNGNESLFTGHFIGMAKDSISSEMVKTHRSLKLNTAAINNSYNYLKYEDGIREITVLFFLDDNNTCKAIRLMSDYSNINDIEKQLNENYEKQAHNNWSYTYNNVDYQVTLEEGDWFFTVSIKEKEEK